MMLGWSLMIFSGLSMLISKYIIGINVYDIIIPAAIFIFGTSLIFSNAIAAAFTPFGHIAGYAGALYSCIQLLGGVVFTACLSHVNTSSQLPMAWLFILSGGLAMLAHQSIIKQ